jgi:hypothetical protein
MGPECVLWSADRSHFGSTDVSSLNRNHHTRHGLHLNSRGKEKLVQLIVNEIRCKPDTGQIPVITGVRARPLFRLKPKSITKYRKDIQITVNKPVLNSEYNQDNNLVVYHQNIRGLSNKTD